jgi:hypothetical protein
MDEANPVIRAILACIPEVRSNTHEKLSRAKTAAKGNAATVTIIPAARYKLNERKCYHCSPAPSMISKAQ